ncbi:MAG: hypothetical protein HPY69_02180 [Armatimonadetes bacterium]|nr:hypothetical protein [Armatimonadota bacterium]
MAEDPSVDVCAEAHDPARQREVLARVAERLIARRLTAPAIFVLESSRPLSFVASQALVFFQPIVQGLLGVKDYAVFAAAIEDRANIEWLIGELEAAEEGSAKR